MLAELVRLTTSDGKTHYGALYRPNKKKAFPLGVVMIHGRTGSFIGEIESAVPPLLVKAGLAVLVPNNRGNGLLGAATETVAGVVPDILAALDYMAARGFEKIVLFGHSKGGIKVAYYQALTADPRVVALGLLSPGSSFHALPATTSAQFGKDEPLRWLKKVHKQVNKGHGARIYTDRAWPYLISAATVVDHGAASGDGVLENLPRIHVPLLAACGSLELEACPVVATLRANPPAGCRVEVLEGADHVYTGKEKDLAALMAGWVKGL